ncbi:hypothetical protein [Mucilaginibacter sp.]|uniref:hypothetical protein n=1 Tax=Mucilaginibacter sp. TaxID=1882438 RepID=UPI002628C0AD|nr:hypothetical protein [Mucilaginibacter sp.]
MYVSKEQRQLNAEFMELYEPVTYQGTLLPNRGESKKQKRLTVECRFCKKKKGKTTFRQDTHLISNLLGQNNFFSIDECDQCNQFFKRAENDLAAYLGISRTINHLRTDVKAPGFQSAKGGVKVKSLGNDFLWVQNTNPNSGEFHVDMQNGKANISLESQKYKPESIYRALLKMALGNLPAGAVPDYELGFRFLMEMDDITGFDHLKRVTVTETDLVLARPFGLLFEKKANVDNPKLPQHIFCLYCIDQIFQVNLPGFKRLLPEDDFNAAPIVPYAQFDINNPIDDIVRSYYTAIFSSKESITNNLGLSMIFPTENLVGIPLGIDINEWLNNLSKR